MAKCNECKEKCEDCGKPINPNPNITGPQWPPFTVPGNPYITPSHPNYPNYPIWTCKTDCGY